MKLEFKMTKAVKEISLENNSLIPYVSIFIAPVILAVTLFPLFGSWSLAIGGLFGVFQLIFGSAMSENGIPDEVAFWFLWLPLVMLAPITIPLDIFASVGKGIWKWFSKRKTEKKIRKAWTHLINRGLDPKKIEVDVMGKSTKSLSKIASSLFAEIISDQLGRAPIEEFENGISEEIVVIRVERHGDKICLIGSLTISERNPRDDGSYNSTVQGRVFGITFSVSEHTRVCKVVQHTSRCLSDVHEDEQLEDLWFVLTSSSGVLTETAVDPWQRRMSKNFASGVICDTLPVEQENSNSEELA